MHETDLQAALTTQSGKPIRSTQWLAPWGDVRVATGLELPEGTFGVWGWRFALD